MIALWPASRRGTEATVPIPPGLVRLMLVPWKSSAVSLPSRVFAIRSSKEEWKPAKSRSWEPLIAGTIRLWEPSLRVTSTAMPRLIGPFSIATGLPSRSPKVRTITGISLVASTIAQATRWVKEVLRPRSFRAALIALRLASRVSTAIVRNEVAVGTARLSSIALASIAAGPRSTFSSPRTAAAPLPDPFPALSTSSLVTLEAKPVPLTLPRSTPLASATRRATGVALTAAPLAAPFPAPLPAFVPAPVPAPLPAGGAVGGAPPEEALATGRGGGPPAVTGPAGCEACPSPSPAPPSPASPASISAIGCPTATSSSTAEINFVIVPLAGAGTSASTLSVDTSTTVSPSLTKSPSATCHSSTMPSVTDSPISGMAI